MYSLYGIVGKSLDLVHKPLEHPSACVVHLGEGVGMIPLAEELLNEIQKEGSVEKEDPGFEFLSRRVADWARRLSKGTTLAYLEAEFISGEGTESAVVWRDGEVTLGPLHGTGAINKALGAIGVSAPPGRDEFEMVGLGRHRSPDAWIKGARLR